MAETPDLKRIGRYDIERVLGEGAMGVVYEGNDTRLHRKVAIKTILKSALDSSSAKEYSMRFAREAQAVARLNHPNIVQVFDFAEEGDVAYIVMELVRGRELKTFFDAKERFELKEIVHIVGELCEALHFAHEAGIVHRDIKPANVMIDAQGRVKLTDFGVARIADPDRTVSDKTQAGTVVGTPAYMSPEQIQGLTLDRRSDIFSAGVILYEFLCGSKPFTGAGAWAIAKKILSEEPRAALQPQPRAVAAVRRGGRRRRSPRTWTSATRLRASSATRCSARSRAWPIPTNPRGPSGCGPCPARRRRRRPPQATRRSCAPCRLPVRSRRPRRPNWNSGARSRTATIRRISTFTCEQFPNGIYAALAKRKSAKLRGLASEGQRAGAPGNRGGGAPRGRGEAEAGGGKSGDGGRARQARGRIPAARGGAEQARSRRPEEDLDRSGARRARARGGGAGLWQALKPPDPMAQRVTELTAHAGGIQAARSRAGRSRASARRIC